MAKLERGVGQGLPCRQILVVSILNLVLYEGQEQILKGLKWQSGDRHMTKSVLKIPPGCMEVWTAAGQHEMGQQCSRQQMLTILRHKCTHLS